MIRRIILAAMLVFAAISLQGVTTPFTITVITGCPYGTSLPDGCPGAQASGFVIDSHFADTKSVIDLNIVPGSGYTPGTYTWTSSGGGCAVQASGTVTVSAGGLLANDGIGNLSNDNQFTISNRGSGCTSRPTIAIPAGAGAGTGGKIVPTVYQVTPHNASTTAIGSNWNVAGVDYPVGYDRTLSLVVPTSGNLPACATISGTTVSINSSNCTLNGYDLSSGISVSVGANLSNVTISNNSFSCVPTGTKGSLLSIGANPTNLTIKYNDFNGGVTVWGQACEGVTGTNTFGSMTATITSGSLNGTLVVEYNYFYNCDAKNLNFAGGNNTAVGTLTEKYNLEMQVDMCDGHAYSGGGGSCAHGEHDYSYAGCSSPCPVITVLSSFNVVFNHYNTRSTATAEMAFEADGYNHSNDVVEYNFTGTRGTESYTGNSNNALMGISGVIYDGEQENGTGSGGTMAYNIIDASENFFPWNQSNNGGSIWTYTSNVNAGTGGSCTGSPNQCN